MEPRSSIKTKANFIPFEGFSFREEEDRIPFEGRVFEYRLRGGSSQEITRYPDILSLPASWRIIKMILRGGKGQGGHR